MHIDIDDLALIRAICEHGSVTRAAEALHLTQSAASWRLKKLEQQVGGALFQRTGRGMKPNAMGERCFRSAQRILGDLASLKRDIATLQEGGHGTVRMASECYTTYHWLPKMLTSFRTVHPNVDIELVVEATEDPIPFLLNGRLDVALMTKVAGLSSYEALSQQPLFEDEMIAVTSAHHPWSSRSYIDASDFSDEHLIVYQRYDLEREPPRPLPLPQGAKPKKISTFPMTTEGVIELVRASMGVTVMASWAASSYLEKGGLSRTRITTEGMWRMWYAVRREDETPTYLDDFHRLLQTLYAALPH
tara:strand:- start:2503 stop:3414 length:912 start_codon:yes stop_codon:yes gene_type:complete